MTIRDRNLMKYAPFLMPEHRQMLRQVEEELYVHKSKPVLDEQRLEELNVTLSEGLENQRELIFTYFYHHDFRFEIGFVKAVDPVSKVIRIVDKLDNPSTLPFESIIDIRFH
ncbi:YolD-like family protein [Bacillus salitolerans]|uniref:YolD-like family protein n=1 Tax=Bacillus salitolerans TaxID=1437434 RepID=A0ABW4LM74_9BACI